MMFDEMAASDFNPMRDVWFPLDLSNAACFNLIMAHSAAHLAYFYDGTMTTRGTNSFQALKYKWEALEMLNYWLNDPNQSLSNDTFAAVVRLLTFERYWGTEEGWRIHRHGLQRMIEMKGGVHELHNDWRLQLVVRLVSFMSHPSWFSPTNDITSISPSNSSFAEIKRMRSLWLISFIGDMRNLMSLSMQLYPDGLSIFPPLLDAVMFIRTDFDRDLALTSAASSPLKTYSSSDYDRLRSVFSICLMLQDSVSLTMSSETTEATNYNQNKNALAALNISLSSAPRTWEKSVYDLRSFIDAHFLQLYLDGAQKINYVAQMTEIVNHLKLEAHRGIEQCLLNMLCRTRRGQMAYGADDSTTPDALLSSLHG